MSPKICSLAYEDMECRSSFEETYSEKVVAGNFSQISSNANMNSSISEEVILVCGRINVSF